MGQTVVGIFEKGVDAQMAAQELESSRISRQNIDISNQSSQDQRTESGNSSSNSVGNFFSSLFGDGDDARKHSDVARKGWVVTVHANNRQEAERAAEILDRSGAIDVDERAQEYQRQQNMSSNPNMSTSQNRPQSQNWSNTAQPGSDTRIPIIEEKTNVGKRETEAGGVRLKSRIVERPIEENMRLREEHVNVERNQVNRPATEQDFKSFKEGEMEIRERKEVPIVNKEARVVEEIKIHKDTDVRNEIIKGTERKTDVEVDKLNQDRNKDLRRSDDLKNRDL